MIRENPCSSVAKYFIKKQTEIKWIFMKSPPNCTKNLAEN